MSNASISVFIRAVILEILMRAVILELMRAVFLVFTIFFFIQNRNSWRCLFDSLCPYLISLSQAIDVCFRDYIKNFCVIFSKKFKCFLQQFIR